MRFMKREVFQKFKEIFSKYIRKEERKKETKEEIEKTAAELIGISEASIFTQYLVGGAFNSNLIRQARDIVEISKEKRVERKEE